MGTKSGGGAKAPPPKWAKFERLVAAIQKARTRGAEVKWNEKIRGRQFDVVIRFAVGSFSYVTAIECRDKRKAISADQVEALVTKARDAGVGKAAMVSSSRFQKGAIKVAERHNVELLTLEVLDSVPEALLSAELGPALQIYEFELRTADGRWMLLPQDKNLPEYLAYHVTVFSEGATRTLDEISTSALDGTTLGDGPQQHTIELPPGSTAWLPHLHERWPVAAIRFRYRLTPFRILKTPIHFDPHLFSGEYRLRNVASGQEEGIPRTGVHVEFDTKLEPGKFYFNPKLEFSYFCEDVQEGTATLVLVESYQHATLVQARFKQSTEYGSQFVPIEDPEEIGRLRKVGEKILKERPPLR